ncbi:SAM-dependent methyltransferase [Actinoalloteichus hoggarensis]|uniref:S-adenosyl methyltransferase n=1 Tax=Actinoalloteichus hoggarensis TaxID=1470176 RepID=A0A221VYH1_9PSEU|nr:SAM-dependent methyltransferase [Actinoalloteichus hoggarensis]ASO18580.1 S-adenosyl methyltransferase [Actinoalloteichus hoggarensis]
MKKPGMDLTGLDLTQPNPARVYDYFLGGAHNFEIDRREAERLLRVNPWLAGAVRENRHFLRRVVRRLAAAGVRQFLDIGSGIPTAGNVHEIALQSAPDAAVVYVDIDPLAVAHSLELLAGSDRASAILGDVREPGRILADPTVRARLDFDRPVGVILSGVLHFVPGDVDAILDPLRAALAEGSHLVITHAATTSPVKTSGAFVMDGAGITLRDPDEIRAMFDGLTLLPPGVVAVPEWLPEHTGPAARAPAAALSFAGVGRRD